MMETDRVKTARDNAEIVFHRARGACCYILMPEKICITDVMPLVCITLAA